MGKRGNGSNTFTPPPQDFRKNVGRFNAKVGKAERTETQAKSLAKKQGPLPIKPILLYMSIFGIISAILYIILNWILAEDDISDEELLAAAAAGVS